MSEIVVAASTVKAIVEETKGLINRLLGPSFDEVGAMIADKVRIYRWESQLKLLKKTFSILEAAGIHEPRINIKVLLPLLETASLEDNEDMSARWASLLASAADPKDQNGSEATFVEILKQLSPNDALVLDVFYEQIEQYNKPETEWAEHGVQIPILQKMLDLNNSRFNMVLDNLLRLRLVSYPSVNLNSVNGNEVRFQVMSAGILCATHLGNAFSKACRKGQIKHQSYSVPSDTVSNVFNVKNAILDLSPKWG